MDSVADLVEPVKVEVRATADNYKEGKQIVEAGGVMLEEFGPLKVTAKVTSPGGTTQHTQLASVPDGLRWTCTCGLGQDFCQHLVATALVAWDKAPRQHRNKKSTDRPIA